MKSIKYLALPFLSVALVMTGCASRKPAATTTTGTNP
ncbi:peptidoglycan-associated lipoprotein, partial [Acinetobacter sp. 11520]|nr:peptidoglycan-associated lipoprotein [Acinetobacter sp. 11520]